MKRLIVLLLALTFLTSFVAPAVAKPWWDEVDCTPELGCEVPGGCGGFHARGHPLCFMPTETGVPPGPPYPGMPPNGGGQCLKFCIANAHATG